MKFKNILITGGTGYVGSVLVPKLLAKGHHVTVYDLMIYGNVLKPHHNLRVIKGDIRDKEALRKATEGANAFIHMACISNDPSFDLDPNLGRSINFNAFQNVIDVCKEGSVKRLIVASSTSQYGIKPLDMDVTEDAEANPITDYAKYKIECERLLRKSDVGGLTYTFVRPATLCGYTPRLRLDLSVNILTTHAMENKKIKIFGGDQMRPALNVHDMVRFYETVLEAPREKIHQQAFNVAYKNVTIKQIAEMVKATLGDESIEFEIIPSDDQRSYHVNTDKMKAVLGFECQYSLADAVRSLKQAFEKGLVKDPLNNSDYYNIKRMKEISLQ